nr:hypothetical protein [Tanacetum cinerariifolium]
MQDGLHIAMLKQTTGTSKSVQANGQVDYPADTGMLKQTAGTLKSVQANGQIDYPADTDGNLQVTEFDVRFICNEDILKLKNQMSIHVPIAKNTFNRFAKEVVLIRMVVALMVLGRRLLVRPIIYTRRILFPLILFVFVWDVALAFAFGKTFGTDILLFVSGDARCLIDAKLPPSSTTPTSWDKVLPGKVNIFLWRAPLDRLPNRLNLSSRGLDIHSILCLMCTGNEESIAHAFFGYVVASGLWRMIEWEVYSKDYTKFLCVVTPFTSLSSSLVLSPVNGQWTMEFINCGRTTTSGSDTRTFRFWDKDQLTNEMGIHHLSEMLEQGLVQPEMFFILHLRLNTMNDLFFFHVSVSTKSVSGCEIDQGRSLGWDDEKEPLVLSWGRTPRLDFDVRTKVPRRYLPRLFGPVSIMDIKSILTQKALDTFCRTFHIPNVVHPQLPSSNRMIHEMPTGKIAAKVSHFEILCRTHGIEPTVGLFHCFYVNSKNKWWMSFTKRLDSDAVCYTKPLDSLKHWNDHFFWVESFSCPTIFPWSTGKNVSRDFFPKPMEFRADDYAILFAHPAPFRKFSEPFLCLIRMSRNYTLDEDTYPTFLRDDGTVMDLLAFIYVSDPTKVKIGERERAEGEARLLDTTVGRVVPLLLVAFDRTDSELEASVEKLFDESDGADQGNSAAGGGQEAEAEIVAGVRSDHGTLSGATSAGKSPIALKQLLASSLLNVESRVEVVATLPFVTYSVSATPEHGGGVPADSIAGLNLWTISAPERFVISLDSSHHSSTNVPGAEGDSIIRSDVAGSSHFLGKELSIGSWEVGSESLHEVFVPRWNIPNDSLFDNLDASREFIDHLAPSVLFAQIRDVDYDELFTEFIVGTARQACLSAKEAKSAGVARLRTRVYVFKVTEQVHVDELNTLKQKNMALEDEKESLNGRVADLESSVSIKDRELKDVDAIVTSLKSQNDGLANQMRELEISSSRLQEKVSVYENCMEHLEKFQDNRMEVVNDKFNQLHTNFVEMALHLEEKFYPHLLTTISCRRWLLTQGMKLVVVKCMNYPEYLSVLSAAISKAIEKGMQDGLSAEITHGKEGRSLADVVAHNPYAEADYVAALQRLQSVNFSLLAKLKANKYSSIETLFDLFRLEESLAERLGLHELQPSFDQLMVPIHHSPDQTVVSASALSLALDVSDIIVQKIRENIANRRSALRDVFVLLAEPSSFATLVGTEVTSNVVPAAVHTTTALSMTFASANTVLPFTIEDYEFIGTGGPEGAQGTGEVASFPKSVEFEKELDTTRSGPLS